VGARAKPDADKMVTRKVNYEDLFGFCNGADIGRMSEINDESQAFEGYIFEETTIPQLKSHQLEPTWYVTSDILEFCGVEGSGETKRYTLNSA
jgi:hypothetical protein